MRSVTAGALPDPSLAPMKPELQAPTNAIDNRMFTTPQPPRPDGRQK